MAWLYLVKVMVLLDIRVSLVLGVSSTLHNATTPHLQPAVMSLMEEYSVILRQYVLMLVGSLLAVIPTTAISHTRTTAGVMNCVIQWETAVLEWSTPAFNQTVSAFNIITHCGMIIFIFL